MTRRQNIQHGQKRPVRGVLWPCLLILAGLAGLTLLLAPTLGGA